MSAIKSCNFLWQLSRYLGFGLAPFNLAHPGSWLDVVLLFMLSSAWLKLCDVFQFTYFFYWLLHFTEWWYCIIITMNVWIYTGRKKEKLECRDVFGLIPVSIVIKHARRDGLCVLKLGSKNDADWVKWCVTVEIHGTTPCLKKKQSKLFSSELRQISINFDNFWQKDGQDDEIMWGALTFHLT